VASLSNAAQLSSMLGWGRISELGAIAGKASFAMDLHELCILPNL